MGAFIPSKQICQKIAKNLDKRKGKLYNVSYDTNQIQLFPENVKRLRYSILLL